MNVPSINLKRGYLELKGWAVDFICVVTNCLCSFTAIKLPDFSQEQFKISLQVSVSTCKVIAYK
jgi:hypothetical protein